MIENSFNINMPININNLDMIISELKELAKQTKFLNSDINKTLLCLYYMRKHLDITGKKAITRCTLQPVKRNKNFPELTERYVHCSSYDPCNSAYKRAIRHLLLEGTNMAEMDISATVVYIFAKFISKDSQLLEYYHDNDFYSLLPSKSRDEQKKLAQIWLQGWYDESLVYNALFPITGDYLKRTAIKDGRQYARNSGLFRDIEIHCLDKILSAKGLHLINHLHDGYYVGCRNISKCATIIKDIWGEDVRFKVKDYSKIAQKSQSEIHDIIFGIDWDDDDDSSILAHPPSFDITTSGTVINDPYSALCGYLLDDHGNCLRNAEGDFIQVPKCLITQRLCMEICCP